MIPVVCVVGAHNSGKTTFLERLIPELERRGYGVGTIKHDVHGGEMDREGKDTWRHRRAGSRTVALSSPSHLAVIKYDEGEMSLAEIILRFFWDVEIVLAEGFKKSSYPKIEVFRNALGESPLCSPQDNLVAVVSDDPIETSVPIFSTNDAFGVADLLERRYLSDRRPASVTVLFDGKQVPLNDFVRSIVANTLEGLCSALRGWNDPHNLILSLRRK